MARHRFERGIYTRIRVKTHEDTENSTNIRTLSLEPAPDELQNALAIILSLPQLLHLTNLTIFESFWFSYSSPQQYTLTQFHSWL